jgi:hypothetical protein
MHAVSHNRSLFLVDCINMLDYYTSTNTAASRASPLGQASLLPLQDGRKLDLPV